MKKKTKKKTFKEFMNSTTTLTVIFILLLILVIVLGVLCYQKDKENKSKVYANIVIPIIKKDNTEEFSINAKTLGEASKYTFKIVNYQKEEINKEEIEYKIEVENSTNVKIKIRKQDSNKDLLNNKQNTTIEGLKLGIEEKENIYYFVEVKKTGKVKSDELINIKIIS